MFDQELCIEGRAIIQIGPLQGLSQKAIARVLDRSLSNVSSELRRNANALDRYSANQAQQQMPPTLPTST
ncbi:hypothetical protein APT63_08870 [Pseudomonas sp. 22-AL-CL-001]|nr:hypothetical protein APT63_08870 [Pseudomonas monteilii]